MTFYRLSKLTIRYNCNLTPSELEKKRRDTLVFDGDNCITNALDFSKKSKGEE